MSPQTHRPAAAPAPLRALRRPPPAPAPTRSGRRRGAARGRAHRRAWIVSGLLLVAVVATGGGLAGWKLTSIQASHASAASRPETAETVTAAIATRREHHPTTTAIGTVLALRSVTLRNELPGTVRQTALSPGDVVEAGQLLVVLDVSVERAELSAQQARAALAETQLRRMESLHHRNVASEVELDRARAERDVARAEVERIEAVIERKTIRAPFRARVGLADVHPGQFLEQGTVLTTLQGVEHAVHVDFTVAQRVASGLREGERVEIFTGDDSAAIPARIVAVDARVDPATRNATVRARVEDRTNAPRPGASVRVSVPTAEPLEAVVVPVSALRKGAEGDHLFTLAADPQGQLRAHRRSVQTGPTTGREVVILDGVSAGERIAAAGSFKLQEGTLVTLESGATTTAVPTDALGPPE